MLAAIVETFPIVFDMSERSLNQQDKEFGQRQWKHMRVFTGIVGCLDGILLKIKCPSMAEVGMPCGYWCRKGFFCLECTGVFVLFSTDMHATYTHGCFSEIPRLVLPLIPQTQVHDPWFSERVYLCAGYLRRTPTIRLCFYGYAWCNA